ncbi:unnamed protein product, partial [Prorocentrum cordatum]
GLTAEFDILATSSDRTGRPYVAMIQGKRLPFYAVQFHPEKIRYVENGRYRHNIPKTDEARCVADDLAEFFASELQKGAPCLCHRGGEEAVLGARGSLGEALHRTVGAFRCAASRSARLLASSQTAREAGRA